MRLLWSCVADAEVCRLIEPATVSDAMWEVSASCPVRREKVHDGPLPPRLRSAARLVQPTPAKARERRRERGNEMMRERRKRH
nr:unnamed protein product [Digitaria exilis]